MTGLNADKLAKVLALAGSDQDGEALAALKKARGMLKDAGMSFTDVAQRFKEVPPVVHYGQATSPPQPPSFTDIFAGFDDYMEAKEPGWKEKGAAEKAAKDCERAAFRKAVLDKYGSEEAALAPCWRERKLREALGDLVVNQDEPWSRWSDHVGGIGHCSGFFDFTKVSPQVRIAIENAYPLPATIQEAHAEYEAWREREREMDAALNWNSGDTALDLVGYGRMERVRTLLETELPARDIADLLFRSRYWHGLECQCDRIEEAIRRDIEALATRATPTAEMGEAPLSNSDAVQSEHPRSASERRRLVLDLLSNPDTGTLPDREIARRTGVSPSTVGNLRRKTVQSEQEPQQ